MTNPLKLYLIRETLAQDAEDIAKVGVRLWQEAYHGIMDPDFLKTLKWEDRYQRLQEFLQDTKKKSWAALVNNEIVGFCNAGPCRFFDDSGGEIAAIYVLNDFQGWGIGKALFEQAKHFLQQRGFNHFYIRVLKNNAKAIAFYKKQGGVLFNPPFSIPTRVFPPADPQQILEEEFYRFVI